jgi:hypothetical protein
MGPSNRHEAFSPERAKMRFRVRARKQFHQLGYDRALSIHVAPGF